MGLRVVLLDTIGTFPVAIAGLADFSYILADFFKVACTWQHYVYAKFMLELESELILIINLLM